MIPKLLLITPLLAIGLNACDKVESSTQTNNGHTTNPAILYTMPEESAPHEGTWLQWPHQYQYGVTFRNRLDSSWVEMTKILTQGEIAHIIVYNEAEKNRVIALLNNSNIPLTNIDFKIHPTDDFWIRDNGPIYVKDKNGTLVIEDWGFNGWGGKANYELCNAIPAKIAADQNRTIIDLNAIMTNEGGSFEIDGEGTFMACKSSILNKNRNLNMNQAQAESLFTKYLGVTHFVWLEGKAGLEITDMHIDGFARFGNAHTIVTMNRNDLLDWQVPQTDIDALSGAKNKDGILYQFVRLPLTQNNIITTYGKNLGYKGSYINYYIANKHVLVPNYNDPNDGVANALIQNLYPNRQVVGIDFRNVYANGGMVHCVTQQQPK
jgi:agmatine deiminase